MESDVLTTTVMQSPLIKNFIQHPARMRHPHLLLKQQRWLSCPENAQLLSNNDRYEEFVKNIAKDASLSVSIDVGALLRSYLGFVKSREVPKSQKDKPNYTVVEEPRKKSDEETKLDFVMNLLKQQDSAKYEEIRQELENTHTADLLYKASSLILTEREEKNKDIHTANMDNSSVAKPEFLRSLEVYNRLSELRGILDEHPRQKERVKELVRKMTLLGLENYVYYINKLHDVFTKKTRDPEKSLSKIESELVEKTKTDGDLSTRKGSVMSYLLGKNPHNKGEIINNVNKDIYPIEEFETAALRKIIEDIINQKQGRN